jgi:hypothetical protein
MFSTSWLTVFQKEYLPKRYKLPVFYESTTHIFKNTEKLNGSSLSREKRKMNEDVMGREKRQNWKMRFKLVSSI